MRLHNQSLILSLILLSSIFLLPFSGAEIQVNTYDPSPATFSGPGEFLINAGAGQVDICACSTFTDSFQIRNVAGKTVDFGIEASRSDVEVSPTSFRLAAEEVQTVRTTFSTSCGTKKSYDLTYEIASSEGISKTITKQVRIGKCVNFDATVTPETSEIDACEPVLYKISITNTGTFADVFTVDFGPYDAFVTDPVKQELILPDETKAFNPSLELACGVSGNLSIPVQITAERNELSGIFAHDVIINPDYAFTVSTPGQDVQVCNTKDPTTIPITIENEGVDGTFFLSLDAPPGISLGETEIFLQEEATKTVDLVIAAAPDLYDTVPVTVSVEHETGKVTQELALELSYTRCYNLQLSTDQEAITSCPGERELALTLDNQGIHEEDISLELSGIDFAELEDDDLSLDPGEQANIPLIVYSPDRDEEGTLTITATLDNGYYFTTAIPVRAMSNPSCYYVGIPKDSFTFTETREELLVRFFHDGTETSVYRIDEDLPAWVHPIDERSPGRFSLEPGQFMDYALRLDTEEAEFGTYTATFSVEVEDKDYAYGVPVTLTFRDKTQIERAAETAFHYFWDDPGNCRGIQFYLIILVILALILLIAAKVKAPKYRYKLSNRIKQHSTPLIILVLAFIGLVAIVAAGYGLPFTPTQSIDLEPTGVDEIVWAEDDQAIVDLSAYFNDPDMDALTFDIMDDDEIEAVIEEDIAVLSAPKDWYGEERVRFIALDDQGDETVSPPFTLRVVEVPELSFGDYIYFLCKQINLFLVLVLFFLIFCILIIKNPTYRREQLDLPSFDKKETPAPKKATPRKPAKKKRAPRRKKK